MIWNFVANFIICSVFITVQFQYEYDVEHWSVTFLIKHCQQSSLLRRNQKKFNKLSYSMRLKNTTRLHQLIVVFSSVSNWQVRFVHLLLSVAMYYIIRRLEVWNSVNGGSYIPLCK
jgi:hypothetical protein